MTYKWIGASEPARQWTLQERPPYLEADPRVSIGAVMRERRYGRTHLLWRDQRGNVVGAACFDGASAVSLALHYTASDSPYVERSAGELAFRLVWKGSEEHNKRPFAYCPRCPRHVDVLVLSQSCWACAKCHRLRNRTATLRNEVRWSERLAAIGEEEASSPDENGVAEQIFDAATPERIRLARRLNHKRVTANALYLVRVDAEWIPTPTLQVGTGP
jgi:ribosomal protein L37AE/L43A